MKALKSALAAVIAIVICRSCGAPLSASAATARFAYADLGSEVYFCTEKNAESAIFIIPQTYCVEILAEEDIWYYVKYAEDNGNYRAKYGYCLKTELIEINEPLENTYLNLPIMITFRTDEINSLLPPITIEMKAAYYGEYRLGKTTLAYVYCNDKFGYVPQTVTDYPFNELPKPVIGENPDPPESNVNSTLITVIVITVVAAAAVVILFFSSKKRPTDN